ncbi:MAG: histidine phosphatase family protein [Candidatus Hodarchaeales archaeon]|jgi:broad specificity phosphatase PhoE
MDFQNLNLNVYLIRHATPQNKPGHWTSFNSPLDEKGRKQSELLGKKLKNIEFHEIITSPYVRTVQTTEIMLNHINYDGSPRIEPWLGEINLGDMAGKPKNVVGKNLSLKTVLQMEKASNFEPLVARLLVTAKQFSFPNGESLRQFWNRVETGFLKLIDEYRNKKCYNIGLVGHGGSFTIIQAVLQMGKYTQIRILGGRCIYLRQN